MGRPKNNKPTYLEHKKSGQARVRIDGRDIYLGAYGSPESWQAYHQICHDLAAGQNPAAVVKSPAIGKGRISVGELVAAYHDHAAKHYGPKSKQTFRVIHATRQLESREFCEIPVDEFGPLCLQRVVERIVENGDTRREVIAKHGFKPLCRNTVNVYLHTIKRMFKWGMGQELVKPDVYVALGGVEGLRKGNGELSKKTTDRKKVMPAPLADIEKTIKELCPELATMVRVQMLCGMRPDEVTIMRPCDIERTGKCWSYRIDRHKNAWRDGQEEKEIVIGPKAQKLLAPFLKQAADTEYLFSPRKVAARWIEEQRKKAGKEPAFVKLNAIKPPREHYDDHSYARAVRRACVRAKVKVWSPGQLRHNAGTFIRAKYGAEAAKLVLGHRHLSTTEIYAEKDRARYLQIMGAVG